MKGFNTLITEGWGYSERAVAIYRSLGRVYLLSDLKNEKEKKRIAMLPPEKKEERLIKNRANDKKFRANKIQEESGS